MMTVTSHLTKTNSRAHFKNLDINTRDVHRLPGRVSANTVIDQEQ